MTADEAYKKFVGKKGALAFAAEKVQSILGLGLDRSGDAATFYRLDDIGEPDESVETRESRSLMVLVNQHENGGTFYCDGADNIPTDEHWHNEMAPWKAAVLEELRVILKLDEEERGYWDNAVAIFRGEIMHPAVLPSIR